MADGPGGMGASPAVPLEPLAPRARTVWQVTALIAASPFVLALLGVAVVAGASGAWSVVVLALVLLAVVLASAIWLPVLRHRSWSWGLTDEGLEVAHGIVVRTESAIPTFRVQQVDVAQGPIQRAFGVVTLTITTASSGSGGAIPGVEADRAEEVRRRILERVAVDDGV